MNFLIFSLFITKNIYLIFSKIQNVDKETLF
nr:MAG TPA: hypothetical protein [Caudoviricetes sp.]